MARRRRQRDVERGDGEEEIELQLRWRIDDRARLRCCRSPREPCSSSQPFGVGCSPVPRSCSFAVLARGCRLLGLGFGQHQSPRRAQRSPKARVLGFQWRGRAARLRFLHISACLSGALSLIGCVAVSNPSTLAWARATESGQTNPLYACWSKSFARLQQCGFFCAYEVFSYARTCSLEAGPDPTACSHVPTSAVPYVRWLHGTCADAGDPSELCHKTLTRVAEVCRKEPAT